MRLLATAGTILLAGCAHFGAGGESPPGGPPLTLQEVLKLVSASVSDDVIIAKLRVDGISARPNADEIILLKEGGASDRLVHAVVTARPPGQEWRIKDRFFDTWYR